MADLSPITNSDLLALSSRLRDGADSMLADRSLAADMRAAADLASRWADIRSGWENPDLSYTAISELDDRLSDWGETGEAVLTTDVYLAMLVVDLLCSWVEQLRRIPNAPADFDAREFVGTMLAGRGIEPLSAEKWC